MREHIIFGLPFKGLTNVKKVRLSDFDLSERQEKLIVKPDIRLITNQNVYSDIITNVHNLSIFKRVLSSKDIVRPKTEYPIDKFFE